MQEATWIVKPAQKNRGELSPSPFGGPFKDARATQEAPVTSPPFTRSVSVIPALAGCRVDRRDLRCGPAACQHDYRINNNSGGNPLSRGSGPLRHGACSVLLKTARNAEPRPVTGHDSAPCVPGRRQARMKHATTREVFAYWDNCRGTRPAPERSDIEPGAIRTVLCDTFILTFDRKAGHPFRLAGTRLCALMGCELKGEPFRRSVARTTAAARSRAFCKPSPTKPSASSPSVSGETESGHTIDLELLLLPLGPSRTHAGAPARRTVPAAAALLGRRHAGA